MLGIEPPRALISSRPCRGASRRTSDGFGGICSVHAPAFSAGTRRRGCWHAWLLLPEGEPLPCRGAAPRSPTGLGKAGAGRKCLENLFGAGTRWEGWKKPPEHCSSGQLVNAWCHLCCSLQNAVRCRGLARLTETWRGTFSHCSSSSLPGGGFEAGGALWVCIWGNSGQGAPAAISVGMGTGARGQGPAGSGEEAPVMPGPYVAPALPAAREGQPKVTEPLRTAVLRIFKNRRCS